MKVPKLLGFLIFTRENQPKKVSSLTTEEVGKSPCRYSTPFGEVGNGWVNAPQQGDPVVHGFMFSFDQTFFFGVPSSKSLLKVAFFQFTSSKPDKSKNAIKRPAERRPILKNDVFLFVRFWRSPGFSLLTCVLLLLTKVHP